MLILINLKVTLYRIFHFLHCCIYYYPRFLWTDLKLASHYFWKSPYKLAKGYGETPLRTLDQIATNFRILSKHRVIELGCGTGRTCFWLKQFVGCEVIGVDLSRPLIEKARLVDPIIEFRLEDMQTTQLDADFIYFYGTSFSDDFIRKLAKRMHQKVITVSFPLSDYDARFYVEKKIEGSFPWGKTDIYLNCIAGALDPVPSAKSEPRCHSNS